MPLQSKINYYPCIRNHSFVKTHGKLCAVHFEDFDKHLFCFVVKNCSIADNYHTWQPFYISHRSPTVYQSENTPKEQCKSVKSNTLQITVMVMIIRSN